MDNKLKQTNNNAFVTGILKEKKIEFKKSKKTGRDMAIGHLIIKTNNDYGVGETKVKVMQFADKKDGTANSLYKGLQTINNTTKSILEVGEENASLLKITGDLSDETYYSVNKDEFINKLEVRGTFVNRLDKDVDSQGNKIQQGAKASVEGYISKITPVNDEVEVELIAIGYEGVAIPVTGTIPAHLTAAFLNRYKVGCLAELNYAIVNTVETKVVQDEVGFGETIGEVIETINTKRVIFGGGVPKFGEITEDQIINALALREKKLEEKKIEAIEKSNNAGDNMTQGFDNVPNGFGINNTFNTQQSGNFGAGSFGGFN